MGGEENDSVKRRTSDGHLAKGAEHRQGTRVPTGDAMVRRCVRGWCTCGPLVGGHRALTIHALQNVSRGIVCQQRKSQQGAALAGPGEGAVGADMRDGRDGGAHLRRGRGVGAAGRRGGALAQGDGRRAPRERASHAGGVRRVRGVQGRGPRGDPGVGAEDAAAVRRARDERGPRVGDRAGRGPAREGRAAAREHAQAAREGQGGARRGGVGGARRARACAGRCHAGGYAVLARAARVRSRGDRGDAERAGGVLHEPVRGGGHGAVGDGGGEPAGGLLCEHGGAAERGNGAGAGVGRVAAGDELAGGEAGQGRGVGGEDGGGGVRRGRAQEHGERGDARLCGGPGTRHARGVVLSGDGGVRGLAA